MVVILKLWLQLIIQLMYQIPHISEIYKVFGQGLSRAKLLL